MKKLITIKNTILFIGMITMLNVAAAYPMRCFAQTNLVGSLGGEVDVSPLGAASYSIPIEVTPGTNGMQPHLAITYNSALGRGLLGTGWTLSGLSSITRTHRNNYYDGAIGAIRFDENDRFALDGERLIKLSSGSYMAENAVYGTEIENFTRVTLNGNPSTQDAMYFTAVNDLGQIVEYGNTSYSKLKLNGGVVYSWMVNKITDADGNYITFNYIRNDTTKEVWPSQINYTGNQTANLSTYAKVQFQYTTDPNANVTYIGGCPVTTTKLLTGVVVKYGSTIVRQYSFEYDYDRSTRLTAVVLQDADGHELTRTSITWGDDLASATIQNISGIQNCQKYPLDYNGDGIPDLLLAYPLQNGYQWAIKEGRGNNTYISTTYSGSLENFSFLFPLDYDGNGRDGFAYVYKIPNSESYTLKVKDFNGAVLEDQYTHTMETANVLVGHFTGTKSAQFLFIGSPSQQTRIVTNSFNNTNFSIPQNSLLSVTDLNGNGKTEFQVVRPNYIDVYEYDEQTGTFLKTVDSHWLDHSPTRGYHGDFNGDGMMDYIYYALTDNVGHWYLKISKGKSYRNTDPLPFDTYHGNNTYPSYPLLIADVNGDGKDDVVQPVSPLGAIDPHVDLNVYYSGKYNNNGDGLQFNTFQVTLDGITFVDELYYQFADLNQDGKNDLLFKGSGSLTPQVISFPERHEHDLIASVTNGFGTTTSLEFKYHNSPAVGYLGQYGKHIHYPLASKVLQPNGIGSVIATTFTYGYSIFDFGRQRFMGFENYHAYCNYINNSWEFHYDSTHHHLDLLHAVSYCLLRNESGGYVTDSSYWEQGRYFIHHETNYAPSYQNLSYGRFIPYSSSTTEANKLENSARTDCCWLNPDGRVSKTSTTYKKAKQEGGVHPWISRDSTVYTFTNVSLPNGITAVRPSIVKTWNRRNGYSQTPYRQTVYAYYNGRLSTEAVSDSDGPVGVKQYTYNSFGLPLTETYTPDGMTARTASFAYDNKGRFLEQETDVLGHTNSATYNKYTGLLHTRTDVNNLTTTYQYDALGRVASITRPDQTTHHISYHWNDVSEFADAVYYSQETETGVPETRTYYDILGRAVHTYCEGQGYNDMVYDERCRLVSQTYVPYRSPSSSSRTWHWFLYDNYNRVVGEGDPYSNLSYTYYDETEVTHHDYFVAVTDNIRGTRFVKTYDPLGRLVSAEDAGGTISYSYAYQTVSGKTRDKMTVTVGNASTIVMSDIRGNRLNIQDPDAGTVTSTYNVLNQLVSRTDANGNQTSYNYDLAGRTTRIVYSDGTDNEAVVFTYDNASGKGVGKLASVQHETDVECEYVYDNLGRLANRRVYDGYSQYDHLYTYNSLGQLEYLTYPDGFQIKHSYNDYGELSSIRDASDNSLIYAIDARNDFRQPVRCRFGNNTGTEYSYNAYGMLTGIRNGNITQSGNDINSGVLPEDPIVVYFVGDEYRDLAYTHNSRGFISTKSDAKVNQSETYFYDELDRLDSCWVNGATAGIYTYSATGNITANSKVGDYYYSNNKPHAVTNIAGQSNCAIPPTQCDVTYNLRNRPATLSENGYSISIDYDASGMRRHTVITSGQTLVKDKTRISDLYELEATPTTARRLDYIFAEGQIVAVHVDENSTGSLYYVLTDHLGSWERVLDENKNTVQQTHFDPWGNRMSYAAWNTPQTQNSYTFDRGFTGHEHYDCMHIINANARLYDPVIGRFFSPDPFVQAPDFTQNYNRYSYCLNNPVMYSDPDGEFLGIPMLGLAFVAELTSNLINGIENPVQTAWNNATATVNGMDNCLQFSVPLGENTYFNFGISPFSIGANAGVSYNNGTSSFSIGGGYGMLSGPYGYFNGSHTIGDATVSIGFGGGDNYYGWNMAYIYKGYGIGYGNTYYGNALGPDGIPHPQMTGTPSIYFPNGSFRLENDYFGDAHDRWRTNAWELTIGDFTLGSTIYTNNPEEMGYGTSNEPSPLWGYNRPDKHDKTKEYQAWNNGFVFDCPLWIGWRHGNSISRVGYRHPVFQDATQNFVHKYCDFGRMHFYINYQQFTKDRLFYGGGYYNPFSLY